MCDRDTVQLEGVGRLGVVLPGGEQIDRVLLCQSQIVGVTGRLRAFHGTVLSRNGNEQVYRAA